jgi:hypothetical protein
VTQPGGVRLERLGERPGNPHRLGRHVAHDPRSLRYAAPALPRSAIVSQRWTRRAAVLDQGDLGSCTGNAAAGWVGTDNASRIGLVEVGGWVVDEAFAVDLYHRATTLDEFDGVYPPEDSGSSGLGAVKALQQIGMAASNTHAFSLQALESALQSGPVLVGIPWYDSMFTSAPDGVVPVDDSSGLAGGHELCVDELDLERGLVGFTNSWGTDWGEGGRGYFRLADLAALLASDGDVTMPAALAVPGPVPPGPRPFPPSRSFWIRRLLGWLRRVLGEQG